MADEFAAALLAAAQAGRSGEIASLLEAASKDSVLSDKLRSILVKVVEFAATNNHLDAVQALRACGRDGFRQACGANLGVAARHGSVAILQVFLQQWDCYNPYAYDPALLLRSVIRDGCCNKRDFACVTRILVVAKASPTNALFPAAQYGEASMVLTLLKAKAYAASYDAVEAMHVALFGNRDARNVIATLVRHKADVDALLSRDRFHRIRPKKVLTLLSRASGGAVRPESQAHQLGCIATLLRLKADVHGGTRGNECRPIVAAANHGGPAVVEALLSAKSRVHYNGQSALTYLFRNPHDKDARPTHPQMVVAALLVRAKAQVDDELVRIACFWLDWNRHNSDAVGVVRTILRAHPVPEQARRVALGVRISAEALAGLEADVPAEPT